jgi:Ca-activated chloride channel family protein
MFNRGYFENSRPDGFGVLEATGTDEQSPRRFVPLKRTELRGEVTGPLAGLRLTQVFGYSTDQCDHVLEALYRIPMPGDAAVTAIRARFGDVTIRAELAERTKAEEKYESAKKEGRQSILATRESPSVFTLQLAGLQPGQDVTIETTLVQLARPEGTGWSLRLPLTTAPRYVREDEQTSRATSAQPLALLRDPGHRFTLDLTLRAASDVQSKTHDLARSTEDGRTRIQLAGGEVVPDRDFVVTWRAMQEADRPALQVFVDDDPVSGVSSFLGLIAPPATHDPGRGLGREVILLVDHSGSMTGAKWSAADWAVEKFLSDLTERDRFSLGVFHTTTRWFQKSPVSASQEAVDQAIKSLKASTDSGGTELGVALEQALGQTRSKEDASRHVLIITDAEVTDEARLLALADAESARPAGERRRVSVLCIDAAPNSYLALELAERGGGLARFLTSDPKEDDIATALDEVLTDWSEPVLAGLTLEVNRSGVTAAGRGVRASEQAGWSAIDLGDLPAGRVLWVAGRAPRRAAGLEFRLATAKGHELASTSVSLRGESPGGRAIRALQGARQVLALEHLVALHQAGRDVDTGLQRLGYTPEEVFRAPEGAALPVYPENQRKERSQALRALLVRESIASGVASTETAFFAERMEQGKVVEGTVAVANGLPAGWSEGFVDCMLTTAGAALAPGYVGYASGAVGGYGGSGRGGYGGGPGYVSLGHSSIRRAMSCKVDPTTTARPLDLSQLPPASPADSGTCDAMEDSEWLAGFEAKTEGVVFADTPTFGNGEAVLYDSTTTPATIPDDATLTRLVVRFPEGPPTAKALDRGLTLLIFVDDPVTPRARIRLIDLVRNKGQRPLNIQRGSGQLVRVVLVDPAGTWTSGGPRIEVTIGWG